MDFLLILGATSEVARAVAHEYARNGYHLYLAARDDCRLEADASDLKIRYGVEVRPVAFDATDCLSHKAFYAALDPKPAGVVWVVGCLGDQEKARHDFEEAQKVIDTNFSGCVSILNIIADDFERRQRGFLVGVSSVAGDRGRQSNYIYGSAKAGVTAYLSGLRNRLHRSGVPVLTVKPGFVHTRMTAGMDLPPLLTAQPREVARDILRAQRKKQDVLYTRWFWRFIMLVILHIPERIFKKLKL